MSTTLPNPPAERFAGLIAWLCQFLVMRYGKAAAIGPVLARAWQTIQRTKVQFAALAARIEAGTFRPRPRRAAARAIPPGTPPAERPKRRPPPSMRFGWLAKAAPGSGVVGEKLQVLFDDPQMQALMEAAPKPMGRILRPLCRMLGVKPPAILARPRRPRPAKPPKPPKSPGPPEPAPKPRPRGLCEPPGRYAPGAWVLKIKPHWRDVLEGTVAAPRRRKRKIT